MPSLKKDATTGALLKNSSGALVDVCGGCTAAGTSCARCDDVTPAEYQVTFSGLTLCSCSAFDSEYTWTAGDVFNTVHTLAGGGSGCAWTKTLTNAVTQKSYDGSGCTGSVTSTNTWDIRIELNLLDGDTWQLAAYLLPIDDQIFRDTQTADTDGGGNTLCATVPSFTNEISSCPVPGGGSATVVCV
ncbi:MAG: hypothetical protein EBY40_00235 [Marivivens sp.]|nr:hypothetical protein [Marivivens sp.]NBT50016.1 hypothetical protein [Marivivens sp.]NCW67036.1 hypothetical protein [Marivivens sp.]NDH01537.1 hypothetical protein [Marivivens sp.]